jgi:hypothetical protein
MLYSRSSPRLALTKAVRALMSRSRAPGRAWTSCCSTYSIGTIRMVDRVTASQMASASRVSFLGDLTEAFTNWGAISRTS